MLTVPIEIKFLKIKGVWTLLEEALRFEEIGGRGDQLDAWQLRDNFIGLRRDPAALLDFLNMAGKFDRAPLPLSRSFPLFDFWEWQEVLSDCLVHPNWAKLEAKYDKAKMVRIGAINHLSVDLKAPGKRLVIHPFSALEAVIATVQVDLIRGSRFRWCKRPDCSRVFEVRSAHGQQYCSQACSHLQVMRKKRGTKIKRDR